MWTVQTTSVSNGIVNAIATYKLDNLVFNWGATIKTGDIQNFSDVAKAELLKYQNFHKDDQVLAISIEQLLNN